MREIKDKLNIQRTIREGFYLTRGGQTVEILKTPMSSLSPGVILGEDGRKENWYADGSFFAGSEHTFDLVKRLELEDYPELYI